MIEPDTAASESVILSRVIAGIWIGVIVFMILRGGLTPPGRPDWLDHLLILCAPLAAATVAACSRNRLLLAAMLVVTMFGALAAWVANTRLALSIEYNGWRPHIVWWSGVTAWVLLVGP